MFGVKFKLWFLVLTVRGIQDLVAHGVLSFGPIQPSEGSCFSSKVAVWFPLLGLYYLQNVSNF